MSNTLRDQLLKAGVVSKDQVNRTKKAKHKKAKQQGGKKTAQTDETRLQVQRAQAEKTERDKALNSQRSELAERKAIEAQVRQLVEQNRQAKNDGDVPYNFEDQKKVKRIFVSEGMHDQIARGRLAIVKLNDQYEFVTWDIAEKIRVRDESCVIVCNDAQEKIDGTDDPYADYQVPDDLMW